MKNGIDRGRKEALKTSGTERVCDERKAGKLEINRVTGRLAVTKTKREITLAN